MLTKLTINGFKCFEHLEIPLLSRVTLIGGCNNVGKTSILEAVFMLFDRLNPQMIFRQFAWRGVKSIPLEPEAMWAPIFLNYDMDKDVVILAKIDGNETKMTIKYNPNYIDIPSIQAETSKKGNLPQIRTDQKPISSFALDIIYSMDNKENQISHLVMRNEEVALRADKISTLKRKVIFLGAKMYVNSNENADRFGQLDLIGKLDKVVEFLKIIEPKLKGLSSITNGNISLIHGDIGLNRKIPISYMGDGVSRLLSIILAIATSPDGIVLIDECENGIHYSVMPKIWEAIGRAAREFNCQVIGTTHSYECLEAAHEGLKGYLEDDFNFIRIDKINNKTVAKTFDYKALGTAISANMEVR